MCQNLLNSRSSNLLTLLPDGLKGQTRHDIFPQFHITLPNFALAYSYSRGVGLSDRRRRDDRFDLWPNSGKHLHDQFPLWDREALLPSSVPYEIYHLCSSVGSIPRYV